MHSFVPGFFHSAFCFSDALLKFTLIVCCRVLILLMVVTSVVYSAGFTDVAAMNTGCALWYVCVYVVCVRACTSLYFSRESKCRADIAGLSDVCTFSCAR